MADTKLPDLTALTSVADGDTLYIMDVSDTTDSSDGTSKKITKANLVTGLTLSDISDVTASVADVNATTNFEETISATTSQVSIATGKTIDVVDNSGLKLAGTAVTSTAAELNALDGITSTVTELNYTTGVTSAIQTQLNAKEATITTLGVANGGTGVASTTVYAPLFGGTTTTGVLQSGTVGTTGQVMTSNGAGALPTFQAAGGVGFNKWFDWSNAVLPDTAFPSLGKTVGTNWIYKTLDFDASTDEAAYFYVQIPTDVTPATANLIIHWTASAGTATQVVYWECTARSIGNDQVIDATTTPAVSANTANDALLALGDIHRIDMSMTLTDWNAGEVLQLKLFRDADNGSDTLTGDAKLVGITLEIAE